MITSWEIDLSTLEPHITRPALAGPGRDPISALKAEVEQEGFP